jgi:mannose-6-phosphate isomerase-like protein (cupin superfamily)
MIKKAAELSVVINENMRGGSGSIVIQHLADKADMYDKNRLFAKIVIKPGCSIGYHVHENEMEVYQIISGNALYDENGIQSVLTPGDVTITPSGVGHSISNNGEEDLEFIALVVME